MNTKIEYIYNGTNSFVYPEIIDGVDSEINVKVNGGSADFEITSQNPNLLTITNPELVLEDYILIERVTEVIRDIDYSYGSNLTSNNLNLDANKIYSIQQELVDELNLTNILISEYKIPTDTTDFNNNLSSDDDTIQKALNTLDDMTLDEASLVEIDTTGYGRNIQIEDDNAQKAFDRIESLNIQNDKSNVKFFGAKGDGVTNDTIAIQNAINNSTNLFFNNGEYIINDTININNNINITFDKNVIINGTSISDSTTLGEKGLFDIEGSKETSLSLTSDLLLKETTINVNDTSTLSAGDYILIESDRAYSSGVDNSSHNKIGWISQIKSITNSTTLEIYEKSLAGITVIDNSRISKLNMITVNINGGKFIGNGEIAGHHGIKMIYTVNSTIKNTIINDCGDIAIQLQFSKNNIINGNKITDCLSNSLLGNTGYGIAIMNGTMNSIVEKNELINCRHSIAGGGIIPTWFISIKNNNSIDSGHDTNDYDCHEPCFYWDFDSNSSIGKSGGFIIRGSHINLTNNKVTNAGSQGIRIKSFYTDTNGINDFIITNNTITNSRYGIVVESDTTKVNNCIINNNYINNCELEGIFTVDVDSLLIDGNKIQNISDNTGGDGFGIRVYSSLQGNSDKILISDNIINNTSDGSIKCENVTNLSYDNNIVDDTYTIDNCILGTIKSSTKTFENKNNFTPTTDTNNKSLIVSSNGAAAGLNSYGSSISFSKINSDSPRTAIVAKETDNSYDKIGLSFFTHPSGVNTDNMVEQLVLDHDGNVLPITEKNLGGFYNYWSNLFVKDSIKIKSPNGTEFTVTVNDSGVLVVT